MIIITCPNNNIPERSYSVEALFSDVLGCKKCDYVINFDDVKNYKIIAEEYEITIEDHFFNSHIETLSYLKQENFPKDLCYFHGLDMEIPIIYGVDKFYEDKKSVTIGLDIFASTFFMLTRWEEYLMGREENGDCNENLLFCVKHGLNKRSIVNEYAELLRRMLPSTFLSPNRPMEIVLSHDVDGFIAPTWIQIARDMTIQTIYRMMGKKFGFTWRDEIDYRQSWPSPYIQFEKYTEIADKYNISEWFYFKVCGKRETEATYLYNDNRIVEIVNWLREKCNPGLRLGFHPSQSVFKKIKQWNKEMARIKELLHEKPVIGRNHHLLFNHEVLHHWENISEQPFNISNCVFHKRLGFRSGICVPYHLFDIYQRRVMNLIETPCQIMDSAIRLHKYASVSELWNDIDDIINSVKKHSGCLVLTWHIYVRKRSMITEYLNLCDRIIRFALNQ